MASTAPSKSIESFDVVILGTGVVQSILAAALVRAGKKVCHVDQNGYYGEQCAAFTLKGFLEKLSKQESSVKVDVEVLSGVETKGDPLDEAAWKWLHGILDLTVSESNRESKVRALESMLKKDRQYAIEFVPNLLFSTGAMVKLLVKSNVGQYVDFKAVEHVFIWENGELQKVPGSKEDVFKNDNISLIDKRRLMKFLMSTANHEESPTIPDGASFKSYLDSTGLSDQLKRVILNALCLYTTEDVQEQATAKDGMDKTRLFVESVGRFGPTPFLGGMYGTASELSQAFCRLAAVYGGTYILDFHISSITELETGGVVIFPIQAPILISSPAYRSKIPGLPEQDKRTEKVISRAAIVLSKQVAALGNLSLTVIPPKTGRLVNTNGILCYHLGSENGVCPDGQALLLLETEASGKSAADDLEAAVHLLLNSSPGNLSFSSLEASPGIGFEEVLSEAERIFARLCPNDEFFPAAQIPGRRVE
ncbi:GDP dissociation inhibitor [Zopfochytrium polystomum]|nr:GDP dissociation inhibitor [Zopfochytrium polystomum]